MQKYQELLQTEFTGKRPEFTGPVLNLRSFEHIDQKRE